MIAAKQNALFFWMFIFPKSRLSSSSGMVIFVSKCYGAMACIPGRPPVQDLLISINNDASGPIFMKDFLQSDPFPTFKSGKADPSHNKSCLSLLFCCFEWGVFAATQKYLPWSKVGLD